MEISLRLILRISLPMGRGRKKGCGNRSVDWIHFRVIRSLLISKRQETIWFERERERAVPEMGTRWRKDFLSAAENLFRTRILAYPDPTQTRQLIEAGTKTKKTWKVKKRNRNEKCRHLRSIIFDYRFRILIKISSDIYANVEAEPLGATGSFNNKIDSSFSLVWMETAAGYLLREEISHPADVKSEITVG